MSDQSLPKPSSPPTSSDVARLANVSRATVSYVLNNAQNVQISENTRQRVLKAAAELGYVPHQIASSLRSGRSNLVLIPFFDWPYNQNSITFLQELTLQIENLGYTVMLRFFKHGDKSTLAQKLAAFHPIGAIVVNEELSKKDYEILSRNGVEAILTYDTNSGDSETPILTLNFVQVGVLVGNYFWEKGHKKVAAIVPKDKRIILTGEQRYEGLQTVYQEHQLHVEKIPMDYNINEARALVQNWKGNDHPTAVFAYNDEYAMLLMSALSDAGLQIPQDIAIVGCDNLPFCEMIRPQLSSVKIDPSKYASEIVYRFDRMIKGEENSKTMEIPLSCELIIRNSG